MNKQLLKSLYILIGLANVTSWIFFEGAYNHFTKPLLMPILMLYLYEQFNGAVVLNTLLIFAALVFSWLGDLALMNADYFLPGVASFFLAQILYIRLFFTYKVDGKSWINLKTAAAIVYGVVLLWHLLPATGSLKIPVALYGISLISMSLFALNSSAENRASYFLGAIGSVLFVISDSLIAIDKFLISVEYRSALIMSTYIIAQYMLVEGLIARSKD
jgi:uncharacterized membrane protein YhhN